MAHRATPDAVATLPPAAEGPVWPMRQPAQPSSIVYDNSFRFILSLVFPDLVYGNVGSDLYHIELTDADGSSVLLTGAGELTQRGPRALWDVIEGTHATWISWGKPGRERFGITVMPDRPWVWLDDPHSDHQWRLDTTQ